MKVSININTARETVSFYKDDVNKKDWVTLDVNPADKKNQPQTINLSFTGFDYNGSLQPLAEMVMDWFKEKAHAGVDQKISIEKEEKKK